MRETKSVFPILWGTLFFFAPKTWRNCEKQETPIEKQIKFIE